MRRRLTVFLLVAPMVLALNSQVAAASSRPSTAIFPFRTSSYKTSMAAARAFGVLVGFERKDRYLADGDVVGVVALAPTFESYIHLEKSDGTWYVVSVTSPVINTISPLANSQVGTRIVVKALGLSSAQYLAIMQVNDSKLTPGTALTKGAHHYRGPTTAIGVNANVGVYSGKIPFKPRPHQWGYVLVLATTTGGVIEAAQSIRISN